MPDPFADIDIPLIRPWLDDREIEASRRVLSSGWVTQGQEVVHFEQEFASAVGAPYACAVSSCTAALHLALAALGIGPGDEVIIPSHTFVSAAAVILHRGATPVFAEIDPATFNLNPESVAASVSSRTKAVIAVHQMGMPCDMASITNIAKDHGLAVIEDAACAVGSEILWNNQWHKIGTPHGDIVCFSFHPRKIMTTGEGGMLTTRERSMDEAFRLLRQHGMNVSDKERHTSTQVRFESYTMVGYNFKMTDIQAAIGREQLNKLPELIAKRRRFANRYASLLEERPQIVQPHEPPWARSNFQSYCVRLPESADQTEVMQFMLDRGIATRKGIVCTHLQPGFRDRFIVRDPGGLSHSERAEARSIQLPLFHQMTEEQQDRVVLALLEACGLK